MLICIDVGNTNITIGIFEGLSLGPRWRISTNHERMPDEYGILLLNLIAHTNFSKAMLSGAIIASVVPPLTEKWVHVCQTYLDILPLVINSTSDTGVNILYLEPSLVGADRIVDAAATYYLYGGPACIVDFGTATTFDAITKEGDYLGGAIAPGVQIGAEALFQRTAKLPRVEIAKPSSVIGRNTTESMQSGLFFGYVSLVEGMIARFRNELGEQMKVVATGGLAELITSEMTIVDYIAPWLTLEGLRLIYEHNHR